LCDILTELICGRNHVSYRIKIRIESTDLQGAASRAATGADLPAAGGAWRWPAEQLEAPTGGGVAGGEGEGKETPALPAAGWSASRQSTGAASA